MRNLIRERQIQQIYSVIETGRGEQMVTMNASLQRLCEAGQVDFETALGRSPRPKEFLRHVKRSEPGAPAPRGGKGGAP